ncbi:hypothetical protein ACFHYQ_26390 [Sphaerimonospora cavernae]|uniref:Uncharacterized protein n=1 Tax=Sphaerimonospora cavernae TaxID=1740611 RepID=A0ABV6UCB5_9ACTN
MTTPQTATRVFFAFPHLTDPRRHGDYNAWHQLDHRPENLALPGVIHGDRWVRSPDCRAAGTADEWLREADYMAMYWFAEPAKQSIKQWRELGDTTLQQGRRPDLEWTSRPLMGTFRPVRGYVHPRVRISAAALPFRPHTGIQVFVTAVDDANGPQAETLFDWYDRVRIPQLLGTSGVAGAWSFRSETVSVAGADGSPQPLTDSTIRIILCYLDAEPVEVAREMAAREPGWTAAEPPPAGAARERVLLASPLRTIQPWQWDWFDRRDGDGQPR